MSDPITEDFLERKKFIFEEAAHVDRYESAGGPSTVRIESAYVLGFMEVLDIHIAEKDAEIQLLKDSALLDKCVSEKISQLESALNIADDALEAHADNPDGIPNTAMKAIQIIRSMRGGEQIKTKNIGRPIRCVPNGIHIGDKTEKTCDCGDVQNINDTERLEWIIENNKTVKKSFEESYWWIEDYFKAGQFQSFREAIDAAIREGKKL